jgi:glutathione S-transferase
LLLYDLKAGMNPRRVRIFLAEKGVSVPKVEVDMMTGENKRPEYLAKNPLGRMPLLELDDGTLIAESVAICRYFESLYPDPPLFGKGAVEIAKVEMWNRRMEHEIMRPIGEAFEHLSPFWVGRRPQVAEYGNLAREVAADRKVWLDRELATRPYIAGETYTIADITAQAAFVLGKNTGTPIPEELANVRRWFAQVSARPSARA